MSDAPKGKTYEFKTEVQKLLSIISHSLYSNREIFLRELISNSSDALDKLRFQTSSGGEIIEPELPLEITIAVDKENKLLTVQDTGVGMSQDELIDNIGTIAHSGSEAFLKTLAEKRGEEGASVDPDGIIGRFGVGFYSVFMVADKVRIFTRSCRDGETPMVWESDGLGSYELRAMEEGEVDLKRGTLIQIHIKDDAEDYLEAERLKTVITTHSNFISFPIKIEDETVNTVSALWREPKFQIKQEQYDEFYKFLSYDVDPPRETIHTAVDAPVQFTSLCFIPKSSRDLMMFGKLEYGLDLYVKRVLIQRECKDLIPEYLGFLKGIVDTEDLPLNISRETLQENVLIRKISTTLVKQVLSHLTKLAEKDPEEYDDFWNAHGKTFRLGYSDYGNREKFAPLLRFNSSTHEDSKGLTSLDKYIERAKPDQKEIYYISGPSREAINLNPHMEIFKKKGLEVLFLYEPVDEIIMDSVRDYKEFTLTSVEHADMAKLKDVADVEEKKDAAEELSEDEQKTFDELLAKIKEILGERVTDVRVSDRLSNSPCCLVSPDGGLTSSMQKILQVVGKDTSIPQKVMELNKDHALVRNMLKIYQADAGDNYLANAVEQLYETSLLMEGYLSDPHKMVERTNELLQSASSWYVEIKKL